MNFVLLAKSFGRRTTGSKLVDLKGLKERSYHNLSTMRSIMTGKMITNDSSTILAGQDGLMHKVIMHNCIMDKLCSSIEGKSWAR